MIIIIEKIFFKTYLNPKVKSPKLMTFVRHVQTPSNLGPMGPFLPAVIPNKGAAAGALVVLNKNSPTTGGHMPPSSNSPKKYEGMNTSVSSSSSTGKNLPPLKGEFTSIAEKVQSNHCTPQKTVQKGPFTPVSEEDKLLEQAKKIGFVKFEDAQDESKNKYKEASGASLTKKGIAIYTNEVYKPELVEKNSILAKDFVDAVEEKKTHNEILVKEEDIPLEDMPLAGMLKSDPENILLLPSQTHLVVVMDKKNDCYLAVGTLTSTKYNNVYLSPSQINIANKNQYLGLFSHPRIVHKEHFQIHREATEFIQKELIVKKINIFSDEFIKQCSHLEIYNPKMLTAVALEKMIHLTIEEKKNENQIKKDSTNDSSHMENNNIHNDD
jgi:hypothetical protein